MMLNWALAGAPYVACDIGGSKRAEKRLELNSLFLLVTSATLVVTGALLVVTRSLYSYCFY